MRLARFVCTNNGCDLALDRNFNIWAKNLTYFLPGLRFHRTIVFSQEVVIEGLIKANENCLKIHRVKAYSAFVLFT